MTTQTQLVTGLAGAIGCCLNDQLVFVEYGGKLSRLKLFPSAVVVSSGTTTLKGTWSLDLDTGTQSGPGTARDIWWEQQTAVARRMTPQNSAGILNLGVVDFNAITADGLAGLPYGATPIPGNNDATNQLVPGDCFAVRTNQGNFSKVKVLNYGYDLNIQWVTYRLNPAYAVLGTGYTNPEDVKVTADGLAAYVTERSGNLLRVTLSNANRAAATVLATGLTAPQQLVLDEAHHAAYVVEYANPGRLWRIDLNTGTKTVLVANLENAVGLALAADLQYAYVSEQTGGADKGRVSRIQLNNGARTLLAKGLTNPFFLTWADDTRTTLLVPERDPANRITRVGTDGSTSVVVTGVAPRPSSVAVIAPGRILVCSDQVISRVEFLTLDAAAPLFTGIGFIPFDKVNQVSGLASTPGAPYPVSNAPFGGRLPIMVNHLRGAAAGGTYFRVWVDGLAREDQSSDYRWNGSEFVLHALGPVSPAGSPAPANCYPVHAPAELSLWADKGIGMYLDSRTLTNGQHTLVLELTNAAGAQIEQSPPLKIMVNNQACVAKLDPPTLGATPADSLCGVLRYGANPAGKVKLAFSAVHPANYANYSFSLIKGANQIKSVSGPVSPPPPALEYTVPDLLGTCQMAGLAESLYVATTITDGRGRQSQYDASAGFAFALAP